MPRDDASTLARGLQARNARRRSSRSRGRHGARPEYFAALKNYYSTWTISRKDAAIPALGDGVHHHRSSADAGQDARRPRARPPRATGRRDSARAVSGDRRRRDPGRRAGGLARRGDGQGRDGGAGPHDRRALSRPGTARLLERDQIRAAQGRAPLLQRLVVAFALFWFRIWCRPTAISKSVASRLASIGTTTV